MESYNDHFSKQSDIYQKYRPTYPAKLFEYLSSLTKEHRLVWDCGTGNGQAAIGLAKHYNQIYATDLSKQQLQNASPHKRIKYKVEKAEHSSLDNSSVDLVTVAQALHWFNFNTFYPEVNRVLKPNGVFAAWTYGGPMISKEVDTLVRHFHNKVLDGYWHEKNQLVNEEYANIPFPFEKLETPNFTNSKKLNLDDLLGLLKSWSAVQRYIDQNGENPVDELEPKLHQVWGNPQKTYLTTWNITLRAGKVIKK